MLVSANLYRQMLKSIYRKAVTPNDNETDSVAIWRYFSPSPIATKQNWEWCNVQVPMHRQSKLCKCIFSTLESKDALGYIVIFDPSASVITAVHV